MATPPLSSSAAAFGGGGGGSSGGGGGAAAAAAAAAATSIATARPSFFAFSSLSSPARRRAHLRSSSRRSTPQAHASNNSENGAKREKAEDRAARDPENPFRGIAQLLTEPKLSANTPRVAETNGSIPNPGVILEISALGSHRHPAEAPKTKAEEQKKITPVAEQAALAVATPSSPDPPQHTEIITDEERKSALQEIAARVCGNGYGKGLIQKCEVEPLSDGEHTALIVVGWDADYSGQFVSVLTSYPKPVDLFWGLSQTGDKSWFTPEEKMWPQGTAKQQKACTTRLYPCPTNPTVQEVTIRNIPVNPSYQIHFVLRFADDDRTTWLQRNDKSDFEVSLDSPSPKKSVSSNGVKADKVLAPDSGNPGSTQKLGTQKLPQPPSQTISAPEPSLTKASSDVKLDVLGLLVDGNSKSVSWRKKLQMVQQLLKDQVLATEDTAQTIRGIVAVAIYLYWVSSGAIECKEDGSHYRPNHHARASQDVFLNLERVLAKALKLDRNESMQLSMAIRKVHPRLPSFAAEFMKSEPLTRIRDIAHGKGDQHGKCRDIRREIKTTLQNKLHRCAGPEDLVTAKRILDKLTAKGADYPGGFVNEFKIFYKELNEFFNASGLNDRIAEIKDLHNKFSLSQDQNEQLKTSLNKFLDAQKTMSDDKYLAKSIESHTQLRRTLFQILQSVLPDEKSSSPRQNLRLCEIGLEANMFPLVSRTSNYLDQKLNKKDKADWNMALIAVACSVEHMAMSRFYEDEALAISEEIRTIWIPQVDSSSLEDRFDILGLKACMTRARRLSEIYCSKVEEMYSNMTRQLGEKLSIDSYRIEIFTESEIRSSLPFQLSRITSQMINHLREFLGEDPIETLVSGTASGRLLTASNINSIDNSKLTEPTILLLQEADGDENLQFPENTVKGIILSHDLPHLSHLALRARSQGLLLIAIEDSNLVRPYMDWKDKYVTVNANEARVSISQEDTPAKSASTKSTSTSKENDKSVFDVLKVKTVDKLTVLSLEDPIRRTQVGSKSYSAAKLLKLAETSTSPEKESLLSFRCPMGVILPFGSLEVAFKEIGVQKQVAELLSKVDALEDASDNSTIKAISSELGSLVRKCTLPPDYVREIQKSLGAKLSGQYKRKYVMVRSSASVEDTKGISGAGLYDSVAGVDLEVNGDLVAAVLDVWASLYTARALSSRKVLGLKEKDVSMAVLVQEMIFPKYAFVLHSVNPMNKNKGTVYAEVAPGHGETLARGQTRGSPWRLTITKTQDASMAGKVEMLTRCNISDALIPSENGRLHPVAINYSKEILATDRLQLKNLGVKLGALAEYLEKEFDGPQDIEGVVDSDWNVWIVQTRPQP